MAWKLTGVTHLMSWDYEVAVQRLHIIVKNTAIKRYGLKNRKGKSMEDNKFTCEDCMFSVWLVDEETLLCQKLKMYASRVEREVGCPFPCELFQKMKG